MKEKLQATLNAGSLGTTGSAGAIGLASKPQANHQRTDHGNQEHKVASAGVTTWFHSHFPVGHHR